MSAAEWIALGALGGVGSLARFLLDAAVVERAGRALPWGTFAVNLSGAFALGVLTGAAVSDPVLSIAGTGAIGGYTTFSTWMYESHRLGEDGELALGVLNLAGSLAAGIAAAALGRWVGGLL